MSLKLYLHPLSSYCHKALIAFYENAIAFQPVIVDLMDETSRNDFKKVWPLAKFPVLRDDARGVTVPESTIIIEYLDQFYPGATRFVPTDPTLAWQTRLHDRFFDHYVHTPMQKIVGDRLRPDAGKDPLGVEQAKAQIYFAYDMIDAAISGKTWMMANAFTLADCAAAPALFYANRVAPIPAKNRPTADYLARLMSRPSYARALKEAEPYFGNFPEG